MQNMPKYHHYFDIDEEYFPQVNEAIIKNNPEIWKKYYPHETFVKLIKDTVRVLSGQQKLSIWVEGAYGTGKSHAVLTLKKLLDCSLEDARKYFEDNPDELSENLCNKFLEIKNDTKKLLLYIVMVLLASLVIIALFLLYKKVLKLHWKQMALKMQEEVR